ncbi:MAG: hypothetical protein ACOY4I_04345 [Bacillota bacterium]
MQRAGFSETIIIRVLFSVFVIFLSLHLLTDFRDASGQAGRSPDAPHPGEWSFESPVVTFYLKDYSLLPHLKVIVNGEVKGVFNNRYVTVEVHPGDVISLDGTYYNRQVSIEVLDTSKEVTSPRAGSVYRLNGNILSLGRVSAKGK